MRIAALAALLSTCALVSPAVAQGVSGTAPASAATPPAEPVAQPAVSATAGEQAATPGASPQLSAGPAAPVAITAPDAVPTIAAPPAPATPSAPAARTVAPEDDAIVVTARQEVPGDPAAALNAQTYEVVDSVDRAVVGPIALGYEKGLPTPVRSGLHNFLANLTEPVVFANFLLQGKPGKALETVGRFAVNSTIGVAGLIDMAKRKPFHLPRRVNGFANTLGFYGIGPGPYLYLPVIGPSSVRDLFGWVLDKSLVPGVAGKPFSDPVYALGTGTLKSLDDRVEFDAMIRCFRDTGDPYGAEREYYLARRKAEIANLHTRDAGRPAPITTPGCPPPE